jgi:hypothetical protein
MGRLLVQAFVNGFNAFCACLLEHGFGIVPNGQFINGSWSPGHKQPPEKNCFPGGSPAIE